MSNTFQTEIEGMEYINNITLGLRDSRDIQQMSYLFLELMTFGNDMFHIIINTQLVHDENYNHASNYINENYNIINRVEKRVNKDYYNILELYQIWVRFSRFYTKLINHPNLLHNDIINNLTMTYEEGMKFMSTIF